jgi:ATP-binding cassette subfamily B protein
MDTALYTRLLGTYLWPQRARVSFLAVLVFTSIGLQLYSPQLVRAFVDRATQGESLQQLLGLAGWFLALALINQGVAAAATFLAADVGWRATNRLRNVLFGRVLCLPMAFHKERTPGELIERIDGDVTAISNFFAQFVVRVAGAVLLTLGVLVLLWLEDWRVGLALSVFVGVALAVLHQRREVAVPSTREEREATAQVFGFVEERLSGLDDLRANGAGPYSMHRMLQVQREWFDRALRAWRIRSTIWLSLGLVFAAGYVLALGLGIGLYQAGAITLGTVYLFFNYMALLEAPLDQITQQLQEFQVAAAGIRRVDEMMRQQPEETTPGGQILPREAHSVEFRGLTFAYGQDAPVLSDVSFQLPAGQTLGLLGRTGSGKTTLVRLLFRLHQPAPGQVFLDGQDLNQLELAGLRRRVGLVTQDVQLFSGTIRDNLTFFDPQISDSRIVEVLRDMGLEGWYAGLPQGLDTPLQAGGSGLSAGESQLLAFARVFLQDPGLVILDEPSSRLDPATERQLNAAVARLLKGRTGIIIAHRLETVARVDQILVLAQGKVLEAGPRPALQADPDSTYSRMVQLASEANLDEQLERMGL